MCISFIIESDASGTRDIIEKFDNLNIIRFEFQNKGLIGQMKIFYFALSVKKN